MSKACESKLASRFDRGFLIRSSDQFSLSALLQLFSKILFLAEGTSASARPLFPFTN